MTRYMALLQPLDAERIRRTECDFPPHERPNTSGSHPTQRKSAYGKSSGAPPLDRVSLYFGTIVPFGSQQSGASSPLKSVEHSVDAIQAPG